MAFKDKEVFSKLFIAAVVTAFICIPIGLVARKSGEFACIETKKKQIFFMKSLRVSLLDYLLAMTI